MSIINNILKVSETLTPLSTLTYLSSRLTDVPLGKTTQFLIKQFIKTYKINLDEIEQKDLKEYKTFNEFFIRKLKADARPINHDCIAISPVDGTIGEASTIKYGRLIQAKGLDYSLLALLGGNQDDADLFKDGKYVCTYLSPANYHRIHMPCDGKLVKTIHIPGKHFPVGKKNISHMEDLYTKNERLVCFFETQNGPMSVIMVGAALVGSIGTVFSGTVVRRKGIEVKDYKKENLNFKRGDELGHFKFGSTVISTFAKEFGEINSNLQNGIAVKMGQSMIVNHTSQIE